MEKQQTTPQWINMGEATLDDKGRIVIPALIRDALFKGQERPKVLLRLNGGHLLLTPIKTRG